MPLAGRRKAHRRPVRRWAFQWAEERAMSGPTEPGHYHWRQEGDAEWCVVRVSMYQGKPFVNGEGFHGWVESLGGELGPRIPEPPDDWQDGYELVWQHPADAYESWGQDA